MTKKGLGDLKNPFIGYEIGSNGDDGLDTD